MEKVKRALRDRAVAATDLLEAINREVIPVLRETRQRFNELVDEVATIILEPGSFEVVNLEPGAEADYLQTIGGAVVWAPLGVSGATPISLHDTTHDPVALYQFQGSMADSSGGGYDLTVFTGTERYTDIYPGVQGFAFDSSTTLYRNAVEAALQITGNLTIEMLLDLSQDNTTAYDQSGPLVEHAIQSAGESNNELYRVETISHYRPSFRQENGAIGTTSAYTSAYRFPVAGICHYAVTRTANVIQHYLNGRALGGTGAVTASTGGELGKLHVGGNSSNPGGICTMASLKIIPSALTAAQVKAEYNLTLGPHFGLIT